MFSMLFDNKKIISIEIFIHSIAPSTIFESMYFNKLFNSYFGRYFLISACIGFVACEHRDEAAIQALIKEQVEKNIVTFETNQLARCHKEAMEEALVIADSIVMARAMAAKDTSRFKRPIKPKKPTMMLPVNNEPITPLFQENK